MTDSMNFGPEWLRNLSSEGTTTGIGSGGSRCQLADYRYGREDMLALYEKGLPAPPSLAMFPPIYSEQVLPPLALVPATDEERQWAARGPPLGPSTRGGRGAPGIGERGGRVSRGSRGAYQPFGRPLTGGYDSGSGGGWGAAEQTEWSPRKDFTYSRSTSSGGIDNWRRNNRTLSEEEDGWRTTASSHGRGGGGGGGGGAAEKWNRSSSWREGDDDGREKRWHEPTAGGGGRGGGHRRMWDAQDEHLPEWATENLAEGGGTFDSSGAFHGSDDEHEREQRGKELQKSASQHNLRNQHAPLVTSKSAVSLSINKNSKTDFKEDKPRFNPENEDSKEVTPAASEAEPPETVHVSEEETSTASTCATSIPPATNLDNSNNSAPSDSGARGGDEDFDKLQEDFVSKLVVDEEPPKNAVQSVPNLPSVTLSNGIPSQPPNLLPPPPPPSQEKWYYQDPQGDLQGPFLSNEMAEWFKAGYFSTTLFVRRRCDERFYTLGELVSLCKGGNPFLANLPLLPPKQDKFEDPEMAMHYQQQFLQAQMMRARGAPFGQGEPWAGLPGFQREMFAPPMMPPMAPEMMSSAGPGAPMLHHLLSQLKMPPVPGQPPVIDESLAAPTSMHMDPLRALVQQMGGLQPLQNRMQQPGMPAQHPIPANGTVPTPKMDTGKMESTDFMQFMQQHAALSKQQQPVLDSLWKHNQFQHQQQAQQHPPPQAQQPPPHQLQQQANNMQPAPQWSQSDKPISMWDPPTVMPTPTMQVLQQVPPPPAQQQVSHPTSESPVIDATEKKNKKEEKKQRDLEEKLAKKEAEEKRKQEQRKQELEKKQQEEKRKKEEERIRKELEKAKKEAEEKRLKELAEKKRLKELRKEEEARKKAAEELKKQEDEKERQAAKEREEFKKQQQLEAQRQVAIAAANQKPAKVAPWSQATTNQGLNFAEIQKIERERKAEQVLILQQQRQMQQTMQEQVVSPEKMNAFGVPLSWANKPMQPNHVKSLAEIQAEEQDRMQKQKEKEKAAQKEKETLSPPTSTIWCGQSLTWSNSDGAGFWDDPLPQPQPKRAQQAQPVKQAANRAPPAQQQPQQAKKAASKQQKEQANNNANSNNTEMNSSDEFTSWCIRTLANMNTQVDIPTFVSFLRTIESALDVRDYCREYLGEKPATQQFAAQFLEKRRSFKPKQNAHKDDMCSPAPAITPSTQHSNDFQEVKGKGKKCKKSKMLKVDARILGFNVTAAQDRINVGDRDYGES